MLDMIIRRKKGELGAGEAGKFSGENDVNLLRERPEGSKRKKKDIGWNMALSVWLIGNRFLYI